MTGYRETVRHVDQAERMREPPPEPPAVRYESPHTARSPSKPLQHRWLNRCCRAERERRSGWGEFLELVNICKNTQAKEMF